MQKVIQKCFPLFIICAALFSLAACGNGGDEKNTPPALPIGDVETLENKNAVAVNAFKSEGGMYGFTSAGGEVIIRPKYLEANDFNSQGIALVKDSISWKYIDINGATVVEPYIENGSPDDFSEGLARFKSGGKFGFFDKTGAIVIEPKYDFAKPFSAELAAVCIGCRPVVTEEGQRVLAGGKWGYIDIYGNMAIEPRFNSAGSFSGGKARVTAGERSFYIDKDGAEVN